MSVSLIRTIDIYLPGHWWFHHTQGVVWVVLQWIVIAGELIMTPACTRTTPLLVDVVVAEPWYQAALIVHVTRTRVLKVQIGIRQTVTLSTCLCRR
jgi:hypothetical protein